MWELSVKIKRLLTILIILLVSTTTFFGCAEVEFVRQIDSYNKIKDMLVVTLNENEIKQKSPTNYKELMTNAKNSIESDMQKFCEEVKNWQESAQFSDYYDLGQKVLNGIEIKCIRNDLSQKITLEIIFSDWKMFGLFYGYAEATDFEYTKFMEDHGPFIDRILNSDFESDTSGLFFIKYSILQNRGIKNDIYDFKFKNTNYYQKYKDMFAGYGISDISLSQTFMYPDDRLYSNADYKEVIADVTILKWDLSDKADDFEMTIYKVAPKSSSWYVLALILSAIFVVIITIILNKKSKKQIQVKITKKDLEKDE